MILSKASGTITYFPFSAPHKGMHVSSSLVAFTHGATADVRRRHFKFAAIWKLPTPDATAIDLFIAAFLINLI